MPTSLTSYDMRSQKTVNMRNASSSGPLLGMATTSAGNVRERQVERHRDALDEVVGAGDHGALRDALAVREEEVVAVGGERALGDVAAPVPGEGRSERDRRQPLDATRRVASGHRPTPRQHRRRRLWPSDCRPRTGVGGRRRDAARAIAARLAVRSTPRLLAAMTSTFHSPSTMTIVATVPSGV